jgi:hypothetical protein
MLHFVTMAGKPLTDEKYWDKSWTPGSGYAPREADGNGSWRNRRLFGSFGERSCRDFSRGSPHHPSISVYRSEDGEVHTKMDYCERKGCSE